MAKIVTDYLDETVQNYANKIAFTDSRRELTYAQLRSEAYHITWTFVQKNIRKKPIAIYLEKSVRCIVALIGVAYSGNFYTILDIAMPTARKQKILDILNPEIIITDMLHQNEVLLFCGSSEVVCYEDLVKNSPDINSIERNKERILNTDALYVIFTSGSTGTPKGVVASHHAVVEYIDAATEGYQHITADDVFGNQYPFYYIAAIDDIYLTIKNGASMHIIPESFFFSPMKLVKFIEEKRINVINWVPSALTLVAQWGALSVANISCVRKVIFGGEVLPVAVLNQWREALPHATFINGYGSTEVTEGATYYVVDRAFSEGESLPLGVPFRNVEILLLNEENRLVCGGEAGEICVRSPSLAYGYYNDRQKTDEVFIQNPFQSCYPERIYRTGDLGRYNDCGELIFVGRKDSQIKRNGHRIELGEVESVAAANKAVGECACVYDNAKRKLVLFFTGKLKETEIDKVLRESLPYYMLPDRYEKIQSMPHNSNGKIDRVALKEILHL